MAVLFELITAEGTSSRLALRPGTQRVKAAIGDRYRIYDEATGQTPGGVVVKRFDNHLVVDGLPDDASLELTDFYARCGVSSPCTLVIDRATLGGTQSVEVLPSSPPLRALVDGSFVIYPSGYSGVPALAVADSEAGSSGFGWLLGGLALAGVAAAGGGGSGGGGDAPTAVSPSPQPTVPDAPGDTTAPDGPVIRMAAIASSRTPLISGEAEAGSKVRLAVDTDRDGKAEAVFETVADGAGQWRIDLATQPAVSGGLAAGLPDQSASRLTATAIDAAQNQSVATTFDLRVDASGPDAPRIIAIIDDEPSRTGVIASGGRSNDRTPTIEGRLGEALEAGDRLELYRNGERINVQTDIAGLGFRFTDGGLSFGREYTYTARVIDSVGNVSETSAGYQVRIEAVTDTVATVSAVTDDVAPRTGTIASGGLTNDSTPTVSGILSERLAAGESLQVFRNGAAVTSAITINDASWRLTDSRLADGNYTYTARVVDAEGAGVTSAGYAITVDTVNTKTATITTITDDLLPTVGTIRDNGTSNDPSPTLSGRLSQALTTGETLEILRDDVVISTKPTVIGLAWTFTDGGLVDGKYDYNVRVVDAAGNQGKLSATYDLTIKLTKVKSLDADGADALGVDTPSADALSVDALLSTDGPDANTAAVSPAASAAGGAGDGMVMLAVWPPLGQLPDEIGA